MRSNVYILFGLFILSSINWYIIKSQPNDERKPVNVNGLADHILETLNNNRKPIFDARFGSIEKSTQMFHILCYDTRITRLDNFTRHGPAIIHPLPDYRMQLNITIQINEVQATCNGSIHGPITAHQDVSISFTWLRANFIVEASPPRKEIKVIKTEFVADNGFTIHSHWLVQSATYFFKDKIKQVILKAISDEAKKALNHKLDNTDWSKMSM